jgi:FlaA1/EpsC-like NDP-sugar epimerase
MSAEAGYDAAAWIGGLLAATRVAHDGSGPAITTPLVWRAALALCLLPAGCGLLAGLYRGRYLRGSLDEVTGVGRAAVATALCLIVAGVTLVPGQRARPETIAGATVFALLAMLGGRYALFAARQRHRAPASSSAVKIIVFGAGGAGTQLVRRLTSQPDSEYRPVALLDDDPEKRRLRIQGIPVLGDRSRMAEAAARTGADVLVIALARASGTVIRDLTAAAEDCGLTPKVIPSVKELLTGGARIDGVRDPRISDLLGRRPVETDVAAVRGHIAGQRVLVTGAGGSIGSELCRQLLRFAPAELIMLDRDESALHAVQLACCGRALLDSDETVLADIRDPHRVREVFERFRPQIVFHAAALKHLPLLERCPAEALKSNVWGTLTVLEAAAACDVQSFVNISTDKAADPVSVLGYSKRIAERLTAHVSGQSGGVYLSVRFGNVLGSRGSVLTTLCAQVAAGGPVTVTHPEVSRYFMTVDEAVQLVLQAAVIGRGGEVLVLDMGEPVRIADMARRLTASTDREIDVVFTGLRPGEKLTEDLLGRHEADHRPHHPLIRQVPVAPLSPAAVTGLDPDGGAAELRTALTSCANGPDRALPLVSPVPNSHLRPGAGLPVREPHAARRLTAAPHGPSTARSAGPPAGRGGQRCRRKPAGARRWGRPRRPGGIHRAARPAPGPRGRAAATRRAFRRAGGARSARPAGRVPSG